MYSSIITIVCIVLQKGQNQLWKSISADLRKSIIHDRSKNTRTLKSERTKSSDITDEF